MSPPTSPGLEGRRPGPLCSAGCALSGATAWEEAEGTQIFQEPCLFLMIVMLIMDQFHLYLKNKLIGSVPLDE